LLRDLRSFFQNNMFRAWLVAVELERPLFIIPMAYQGLSEDLSNVIADK